MKCDYCSSPAEDIKDMGTYMSNLCMKHAEKCREMEE